MPQIRNFADAHKVLAKYAPQSVQEAYTLDRMHAVMQFLDNPQDKIKVVHVAGTSGKTSTSYYIATLLQTAGQKVGLTVSPHIDEVNERVQVNLTPMPESEFCDQLGEFIDLIEPENRNLTYFEILVSFAYWQFAKQKVDYAVVEVGLGGLLDGTNVVNNKQKICVITDIGFDHTHILGNSLAEITVQKAGIIQDHNPIFINRQGKEVMRVINERCKQQHAQLFEIDSKPDKSLGLPPFQRRNFGLANEVYKFIVERDGIGELDKKGYRQASKIRIPARMEVFNYIGKTLIIDGSHNAQKMKALAEGLNQKYANQKIAAMVGFLSHKEPYAQEALSELLPLIDSLIITEFEGQQDTHKRSMDSKDVAEICINLKFSNYKIINQPLEAFDELIKSSAPILLVTGSFYLLNHIRPLILKP